MPANWLCSGVFLLPRDLPALHSLATDHWPLFFRSTPHAPGQRVQAGHRPSPAGYCHPPTSELGKTERDPISTSGPSIFSMSPKFSMSPNQAISSDKSIRFSPLAAARSLTTLSGLEALKAKARKGPPPFRLQGNVRGRVRLLG